MKFSETSRKLLIIPAMALGLLVLVLVVKFKQPPEQLQIQERSRAVRVIPAPEVAVVPRAVGYGTAKPGRTWEAVAEVGGKVVETHPELNKGSLLRKDEVLLRIDPAEYGLAKIRAQADVETLDAQLKELKQKEKNIRHSLDVEKRSLVLSKKELDRKQNLWGDRHISKSELDQEEKRVLAQQNALQNFQNTLNLIPTQQKALLAKIASSKAQLKDTGLDIAKTTIKAPFDCRIAEVNVELAQYVAPGKVLVRADNTAFVEILAQIPIHTFKNLLEQEEIPLTTRQFTMEEIREFFGLGALVRLDLGGKAVEWKARFARISETLDPQTRTLGVYVAVDDPYRKILPGKKPPLLKNMYCEVELKGKPRPKTVIIPRAALHEGIVYVVSHENRLERRKINPEFAQGNFISIKNGLTSGDRVIVTDVIPAIEGMLLEPQTDEELLKSLIAEALGEAPLK
ncbi:MAG: efflux transporter periplasmic adaptor subunit [Thermodesulfobacteriota bacterium]|nr:efflux transporter periplasmic adaptor subunit [Thermodesulfobacteriota bacterium]